MKKKYMKPTMNVVQLQHRTMLLQASPLNSVNSGDVGLNYVGGGSGPARVRQNSGIEWDNWDE